MVTGRVVWTVDPKLINAKGKLQGDVQQHFFITGERLGGEWKRRGATLIVSWIVYIYILPFSLLFRCGQSSSRRVIVVKYQGWLWHFRWVRLIRSVKDVRIVQEERNQGDRNCRQS